MRARFVGAMVRRELRSAVRRFGLYGGCMAIGIAVVVGLHSLREAVNEAVEIESRSLLGADLRLESRQPFGPETGAALEELEVLALAPPTRVTRLGSMALAESSGRSRLVDLLAIEGRYPIYGEVWTEPRDQWGGFDGETGRVYADLSLLLQLDVDVGDRIRLGGRSFEIAAAVRKAPGGFGLQAQIAPRIFLAKADLDRTDLLQEGSLAEYQRLFELPPDSAAPWLETHEALLEEARVRSQTVRSYQEEVSDAFDSLTRYLGLVGLAALVLGGIGVAAGIRIFVREKLESVALLRSLGAAPEEVVAVYAILAVLLGLASGGLGVILCLPLVASLPALLGDLLPVEVSVGVGPEAVATGIGLCVAATLLCSVGPVLDLARVAPLRALRRDFSGPEAKAATGRALSTLAVALCLAVVSVWQAGTWRVGLGFAAGLCATLAGLALAATLFMRVLRRHPPRRLVYWARQGIANLFRPRNHTLATTLAIGFALFVVATIHVVQRNVLDQLAVDTRPDRPNFVLFDVQRDQAPGVEALLADHGAAVVDQAPLVSARLAGAGGRRRSAWLADEDLSKSKRWALQREYRLTYADALRDSEELVEGRWWSPGEGGGGGPIPVSVEQDLARSLDVGIGDPLLWQIQGVEVETVIASLRQVDWGRMSTNFFVVFPVAALEGAPQSRVLLAHLADERARAELQRDLVSRFPNVSALDATLILRSLDVMLSQISIAIRVLSLFTLGTGIAILVAASIAARSERAREALLLRVLGASRGMLRRIVATEAVALAALAALVGGALSLVASWIVVAFVFELRFAPPLLDVLALSGLAFAVTAGFGGLIGVGGLGESPQAALRREAV